MEKMTLQKVMELRNPKILQTMHIFQHTSAAAILRDVGAVEFLSVMRKDCSPSLHAYIDQVLENLFLLPEADYIQTSRECVYVGTPAPGNTGVTSRLISEPH